MTENGKLPSSALVRVQGDILLEQATAAAYMRMKRAAYEEDGIRVEIPTPAGGYRSLWMQRDMHANPARYNLDPRSSVPLAQPGYSTHGWGTRVDIVVGQGREWAIRHAARFGFVREFGAADPGHFKFTGTTLAGGATTPLEDDMPTPEEIAEAVANSPTVRTLVAINRRNERRIALLAQQVGVDPEQLSDAVIDRYLERLRD